MPDGHRRSREGWSDTMEDGPPAAPAHVHRLPKAVRVAVVGLSAAVFLLLVAVGLMAVYVYQQQLYVQGRGEFRDAEAARMEAENEERTRRAACDLLDTFPAGIPGLERARAKYDCGPGIPRSLLTPEEQARIAPPPPPPAPAVAATDASAPSSADGARMVPSEPAPTTPAPPTWRPPRPTPAPPSSPLAPITDLACDLIPCD